MNTYTPLPLPNECFDAVDFEDWGKVGLGKLQARAGAWILPVATKLARGLAIMAHGCPQATFAFQAGFYTVFTSDALDAKLRVGEWLAEAAGLKGQVTIVRE